MTDAPGIFYRAGIFSNDLSLHGPGSRSIEKFHLSSSYRDRQSVGGYIEIKTAFSGVAYCASYRTLLLRLISRLVSNAALQENNYRLATNEKENTQMKLSNAIVTLSRHWRTRLSAVLIPLVSLAVLIAPARAWNLSAEATIYDTIGNQVGKAKLTQEGSGNVAVHIHAHDLPPGFHGFHVHAVGVCSAPFTSAGGHFDLDAHTHRDHSGDLPILLVKTDGTANAKFNTDRFTVADLFDADGSAIIIHANPDNYANIPTRYATSPDATTLATGDAGDRIACGVVEKIVKRE